MVAFKYGRTKYGRPQIWLRSNMVAFKYGRTWNLNIWHSKSSSAHYFPRVENLNWISFVKFLHKVWKTCKAITNLTLDFLYKNEGANLIGNSEINSTQLVLHVLCFKPKAEIRVAIEVSDIWAIHIWLTFKNKENARARSAQPIRKLVLAVMSFKVGKFIWDLLY